MWSELRERLALRDRAATEYQGVDRHAAPDVVLLQDGTHLAMVHLDGKPLAQQDDAQRYAERRRRHAVLRALSDPNIVIYEHMVVHDRVAQFRVGTFRSAYGRQLAEDYHAATDTGALTRAWFITIMARPAGALVHGLLGGFRRRQAESDAALRRQIEERCALIVDALRDYAPRRLGTRCQRGIVYSEIAEALRLILYGRWAPVPMPAGPLAAAIYSDRIICGLRGFEIRGAGRSTYGMAFGLLDYPEKTPPWLMDGLRAGRDRLVVTNSFRFQARGSVTERLGLRGRQMANAQDPAISLAEGLDEARDEAASGRGIFGDHHFSAVVHVDTPEALPAAASRTQALLLACGLATTPETLGCEAAVWAQLPDSPAWLRARYGMISGHNFLSFSPCGNDPRGGGRGPWGEPILRLRCADGTAHDFHPHAADDVGHALLFGPTGSGKTVFLAMTAIMLEPVMAARGGIVVLFDADKANELAVRACGGFYISIRRGRPSGMAPLKALAPTPENLAWLQEFVIGLIVSDGKPQPSAAQVERLGRGIRFVMRLPPGRRSLLALRQFLDHEPDGCGARLEPWCEGGSRGWAFDGAEDHIRLEAGLVGIDNTELLGDDTAAVRELMAAYQLWRIGEKVGTGAPAAVLVDEAQAYLPSPRFAAAFEMFVTRLRKGNGILWMAMQQLQAVLRHAFGLTLVSNSPTKLLFPDPAAEAAAYREGLRCTEGELAAVREGMLAMGRGTFLVKRESASFIARADLSGLPDHLAVLAGTPRRRALAHRIMTEVGEDPARWVPLYRQRYREAES
ncbi:Type IV secretion system protein VirB4 (plasmid) [Rhodovastum atsumiense]|nr:type IV secretion system protein VirB4 [Rhodovastum atsumiense]CAH2606360.1 Type IV secretion system protein VirB4 [Rhodovastum atsumiense]